MLDYLSAAAICAMHLSRLGAEIVLWSSEEFGFLELGDSFSSGSSIMPQKKNPDAAELLRAKAPRVAAHLDACWACMHALPLAYNKDMQEDKEHLFDAVDTLELCLEAATGMLRDRDVQPRAPRGGRRATSSSPRPTSPTCWCGAAFRSGSRTASSPGSCATRSRTASGCRSSAARSCASFSDRLDDEYYEVLANGSWLESKVSEGGTASARVREQLERARGGARGDDGLMAKRDARMVPLGYGKFVRADRIFALVPLEPGERGDGRRTYVHVEGLAEPIVASRSERAILADVEAALTGGGRASRAGRTARRQATRTTCSDHRRLDTPERRTSSTARSTTSRAT